MLACLKISKLTKEYSNLPESYIKRASEKVYYRTPRGHPQYLNRTIKKKNYHFTTDRPWSMGFQRANEPGVHHPKVFLEPIRDWSFFKGDRVEILTGRDQGKQGIINQVIQERNWVIVEGLNTKLKEIGKTKGFPGLLNAEEQPLLVTTEVRLVDPTDLKACDIEWRYTEEGEKVRVSVRTGRILPIPPEAQETYDYKTKATYAEANKDTRSSEISEITFSPKLETFEMSIMRTMGIKEDRIPTKTYWY